MNTETKNLLNILMDYAKIVSVEHDNTNVLWETVPKYIQEDFESWCNEFKQQSWKENPKTGWFYYEREYIRFCMTQHLEQLEKINTDNDWILLEHDTPILPDFYEVTRDYGDGDYVCDILWWQVNCGAFKEGGDTEPTVKVTNVIAWKKRSNPYIPDEMVGRVKF